MHMRFPFGKKNGNSEGARKRGTELIRKHKRLFALAFVMIIGAGIGIHARMKTNASNTEPVMNTETVQKQDLRKSITLNGTIASMEKATLTSELTDTYIKQLTVKVGDHVTKGQVLAVLDTTSLEKQLKAAKMALENSKSKGEMSIVAANRSLDNAEQSMQSQASQGAQELQNTTDKMNQNNVDLQNAQLDIASYVTKEAELQAEIDKAKAGK